MALQRQLLVSFASIPIVIALFSGGSSGLQYWVGDSVWSIPPYPNYYSEWSSSHLFHTGDSLVFDFETEFYNLMQVPILDYQNCSANSPVKVLIAGPAIILLNQPGVFYFLCNFSNYCDLGQKISINVQDKNSPSPAPVPAVAPAPSSLPTVPASAPFWSREPSPGNWNESESPGRSSSSQAPSPADLSLHTKSCGTSSGGLISLAGMCFALFFL